MIALDSGQGPPSAAAVADYGASLWLGYLDNGYPGRNNLTASYIADLHAHGVAVGCIAEWSAARAMSGATGGQVDGDRARQALADLGAPPTVAAIFAVDFDVTGLQLPIVFDYVSAAKVTAFPYLSGVYGSVAVVEAVASNVLTRFQTDAWSHGLRSKYATVCQRIQQVLLDGAYCDVCDVLDPSMPGMWRPVQQTEGKWLMDGIAKDGDGARRVYVRQLYQHELGREPSGPDLDWWVWVLASTSADYVTSSFYDTPEAQAFRTKRGW